MPDQTTSPTPHSPASPREEAIRVFVSYAREDRKWIDPLHPFALIPFLEDSLRRHHVTFWYDRALQPGDEFKRFIEAEIDKSQIALLLVSQSFLNSEFIEEREMPRIHERARNGEMIIIPVLVGPCKWNDYPFLADRQMVPNGNPLIRYTDSESKWEDVKFEILEGLAEQVKRIHETRASKRQAEQERITLQQKAERASAEERQAAEQRQLGKQRLAEEAERNQQAALNEERYKQEEQTRKVADELQARRELLARAAADGLARREVDEQREREIVAARESTRHDLQQLATPQIKAAATVADFTLKAGQPEADLFGGFTPTEPITDLSKTVLLLGVGAAICFIVLVMGLFWGR